MTNLDKYTAAFQDALDVEAAAATAMAYGKSPAWDSVGHMRLIANLEDAFGLMLDMDDIIDFSSFAKGKEILKKYDVEI